MSTPSPPPSNSLVTPLLTDLYQITMTYAHWKNGRHQEPAVFELFFRKNPFKGAFTLFCGLDEVVAHLHHFKFTPADIYYLKSTPALQHCDEGFFDYLLNLTCADTQIQALDHGSLAFPRVPLIIVSGPLGVGQLLETTLLTLVNYPSLLATNAARMVLQAEKPRDPSNSLPSQCRKIPKCAEFGLRRAQGPDGGFSASKYAYIGGFVGTSNVKAGQELGIPIAGTHAHAFVQSYLELEEVQELTVVPKGGAGDPVKLLDKTLEYRTKLGGDYLKTNNGELAAFVAYGCAFPDSFLALVDTYDTLHSGLLNFCLVSLALHDLGYTPKGIRLDSGDLAALSMACATKFAELATSQQLPFFNALDIVASNDINEKTLVQLNQQGHAITLYGIGTNLVTCQAQPALGCVYKLVELNGKPRLKLSQDPAKVLIPGRKVAYRLWGKEGRPLVDLLTDSTQDQPPQAGQPVLCRNPFDELDRVLVTPTKVQPLHGVYFDGGKPVDSRVGSLNDTKANVAQQLETAPQGLLLDGQPYSVMVSDHMYKFLHAMWQEQLPVKELS